MARQPAAQAPAAAAPGDRVRHAGAVWEVEAAWQRVGRDWMTEDWVELTRPGERYRVRKMVRAADDVEVL